MFETFKNFVSSILTARWSIWVFGSQVWVQHAEVILGKQIQRSSNWNSRGVLDISIFNTSSSTSKSLNPTTPSDHCFLTSNFRSPFPAKTHRIGRPKSPLIGFGRKSTPRSRRGARIGGNESTKLPGAPWPLQDFRNLPQTNVLEPELLQEKRLLSCISIL